MINIIVAIAANNAIGKDNRLLWHISEDLKYFRRITLGHTVAMGRKTFESIGKPLPNRRNIVISRTLPPQDGAEVYTSITEALPHIQTGEDVFIIGGGVVYREALPLAQKLYVTQVGKAYEADTFFPEIKTAEWREISREDFPCGEQFPHPFSFVVYERK
ncbi:MAG: dihydrofolate reductase [Prevotellaceae bacterium]|jgi:dihydrofolate reductase|nr:dihydrofolate reductase [Prevotellaceae bacterium]